jgi:hypothetical protein
VSGGSGVRSVKSGVERKRSLDPSESESSATTIL